MENPTLPTNWLAPLSNANHDGTTQQIDDAVGGSDMTPVHPNSLDLANPLPPSTMSCPDFRNQSRKHAWQGRIVEFEIVLRII